MSSRVLRYHATNVNNFLEHVSAHDTETQAIIVANVVDQNGREVINKIVFFRHERESKLNKIVLK